MKQLKVNRSEARAAKRCMRILVEMMRIERLHPAPGLLTYMMGWRDGIRAMVKQLPLSRREVHRELRLFKLIAKTKLILKTTRRKHRRRYSAGT
jgi:hypothetical protein